MRKLKTPEEIIESDIDYVDFPSNKTLMAFKSSIERMIKAAQRDALECRYEEIKEIIIDFCQWSKPGQHNAFSYPPYLTDRIREYFEQKNLMPK